ncbi:ADAMTS-like protein 3 [Thrips palmi]|uniref:ADAMTS-like protein 3 n=1 Tax=Thrips palmi TaxID=161013 RepID=A0A6P8Z0T4_THRPL|nr:ADAMTS-like protein 3 [Thrips palmi]
MSLATETWTSPSDTLAEDHTRSTPANTSADVTPWALETRRERAHERPLSPRGWSTWSDWSTCSRSCDGGASYQLRRCKSAKGCRGEAMRYKICNMQPCQDAVDFRAQQCEAWNREERHNRFYRWTPYHDEQRPCSLVCRGEPVPDDVPATIPL